jgi:mannose-6-phosphate isomerase-like protein (cupin superfamily)
MTTRGVTSGRWTAAEAMALVEQRADEAVRYAEPFAQGSMRLGIYAPRGHDPQQPHDQDELYFVLSGSGTFVHGAQRTAFGPGDALFVAAGTEHRFEDFTDDFATWVVFWGPDGGE